MSNPLTPLVVRSRLALQMNQLQLAELVGTSLRTVQRFETGRAPLYPWHLHKLVDALRPHDPDLAAQIDVYAPRAAPIPPPVVAPAPVLPAPAPPPPPPLPPPIPAGVLVDSVVCAAAEAMSVAPQAIRPAVLAAFARARDTGLTMDGVVAVLAPPPPPEPMPEATSSKGKGGKGGR